MQGRTQIGNFQLQYLLIIKTYFANISQYQRKEEDNVAPRQL